MLSTENSIEIRTPHLARRLAMFPTWETIVVLLYKHISKVGDFKVLSQLVVATQCQNDRTFIMLFVPRPSFRQRGLRTLDRILHGRSGLMRRQSRNPCRHSSDSPQRPRSLRWALAHRASSTCNRVLPGSASVCEAKTGAG